MTARRQDETDDAAPHLVLVKDPLHADLPAGMADELRADIERLRLPELEPVKGWRRRARRRAKH